MRGLPEDIKSLAMTIVDMASSIGGIEAASVKTFHQKFDNQGTVVGMEAFDLDSQESEGTQKIFAISGLLVDALKSGKTLIIDEFDARLHPLISIRDYK